MPRFPEREVKHWGIDSDTAHGHCLACHLPRVISVEKEIFLFAQQIEEALGRIIMNAWPKIQF
jgi:hypothetical protein